MSWLFSRALVEEFSAATSWDGESSAPLSVMPTQHKFWRNDKTMDASQLSRFGLTCAVLTEDRGEALLTWFRADSRVRTYPLLGMAPASMASVPASGAKWQESSVKYDLDSFSWRTHRCLWDEALPWSSVTLPSWGMTRSGCVYRHPTAERPISGTVSGLWPTPKANDAEKRGNFDVTNPRNGLPAAAKSWPTPVASMSKGSSPASLTRKSGADRSNDRLDHAVMASDGGQLNPTWVEWLMGWPIGWTDLRPLEMGKFHEWQRQHSPLSQQKEAA
jgi:hypothetical protein